MLTNLTGKRIAVVGAHPDDIELGCGGLLLKLVDAAPANRITAVILTCSTPRLREATSAAASWGGASKILCLRDGAVTCNGESIAAVEEAMGPVDVVITMSPWDTHQDHRAAFEITMASCRRAAVTLISYHSISSTPEFRPNVIVNIESVFDKKLKILKLHDSQMEKPYMHAGWLESWHHDKMATAAGVKLAELFHIHQAFDR